MLGAAALVLTAITALPCPSSGTSPIPEGRVSLICYMPDYTTVSAVLADSGAVIYFRSGNSDVFTIADSVNQITGTADITQIGGPTLITATGGGGDTAVTLEVVLTTSEATSDWSCGVRGASEPAYNGISQIKHLSSYCNQG